MENIEIKFIGNSTNVNDTYLQVLANKENRIFLEMEGDGYSFMTLDLQTAIRFSKELRKQISIIKNFGDE